MSSGRLSLFMTIGMTAALQASWRRSLVVMAPPKSSIAIRTDVVADDQFTAEVTVRGSMTYSTQIGGSTTVPLLEVDGITVR